MGSLIANACLNPVLYRLVMSALGEERPGWLQVWLVALLAGDPEPGCVWKELVGRQGLPKTGSCSGARQAPSLTEGLVWRLGLMGAGRRGEGRRRALDRTPEAQPGDVTRLEKPGVPGGLDPATCFTKGCWSSRSRECPGPCCVPCPHVGPTEDPARECSEALGRVSSTVCGTVSTTHNPHQVVTVTSGPVGGLAGGLDLPVPGWGPPGGLSGGCGEELFSFPTPRGRGPGLTEF